MELFRREALDGQDRLHGDVVFVAQVSWKLLAAFLAAALAAAALYLLTAQYRPALPVTGRLAAENGSLVAVFEVPASAAATLAPQQALRLSAPGLSSTLEARVSAIVRSGEGATIVRAKVDADSVDAAPPGAGIIVRTAIPTRSRALAAWLYEGLGGSGKQ